MADGDRDEDCGRSIVMHKKDEAKQRGSFVCAQSKRL